MTASIKPEIHNIATLPEEDRTIATGNMPKNLVKIGCAVPEICSWTDKQRNTQTDMIITTLCSPMKAE